MRCPACKSLLQRAVRWLSVARWRAPCGQRRNGPRRGAHDERDGALPVQSGPAAPVKPFRFPDSPAIVTPGTQNYSTFSIYSPAPPFLPSPQFRSPPLGRVPFHQHVPSVLLHFPERPAPCGFLPRPPFPVVVGPVGKNFHGMAQGLQVVRLDPWDGGDFARFVRVARRCGDDFPRFRRRCQKKAIF